MKYHFAIRSLFIRVSGIVLIPFLLTGCIRITLNPLETPAPIAAAASPRVAFIGPTSTPTPEPSITPLSIAMDIEPTLDLTRIPQTNSPPRSLYFLVKSGVWVLRPGATLAERLTPEDSLVTAFDVWPGDGRIVYGTLSGKLYVVLPGKDPRLLVKPEVEGFAVMISGAAWSPDGNTLAYTVDYDAKGDIVTSEYPSRPSGVWTVSLDSVKPTWLLSNHYLSPTQRDLSQIRLFSNPRWSPDGAALLLTASYWEWTNQEWLYPLQYREDGGNLHSLEDKTSNRIEMWNHAVWMPDSQGVLLSGRGSAPYSDLVWASRDVSRTETLISGVGGKIYVYDAYMVPDDTFLPGATAGIAAGPGRLIYLASCPECLNTPRGVLWTAKSKWVDPSQNGGRIGPDDLCHLNDAYGYPNSPRHIEWRADFSYGVLTCGWNEIYLVQMRLETPLLTDLLPALPALGLEEVPVFRWGEVVR